MDSVTGAPIMNVKNWRISDFFCKLTKCSLIRYFVSNSFTDNCLLSELTTPIGNVGCPIHDHKNVYLSENNHHQILLKHNWIFTKADKKGLQLGCLFFHWRFCYYFISVIIFQEIRSDSNWDVYSQSRGRGCSTSGLSTSGA